MAEKFVMFSLDDERTKNIAEVISNPTSKKIITLLSDKGEASESDIAGSLGLPMNTVEYNLKKLETAGLIEKSKNFFWSPKGKKIIMYKLSNKKIVIQPKGVGLKSFKAIVSIIFSGLIVAILLRYLGGFFSVSKAEVLQRDYCAAAPLAGSQASEAVNATASATNSFLQQVFGLPFWTWFFIGVAFAVIILLILNLSGGKNNEHKSRKQK